MRRLMKILALITWIVVLPAMAYAQGAITGVVRGSSGQSSQTSRTLSAEAIAGIPSNRMYSRESPGNRRWFPGDRPPLDCQHRGSGVVWLA